MCFVTDDGISIPCEYTSFLAPVSAAKLHYEVSQSSDAGKGPLVNNTVLAATMWHSYLKSILKVVQYIHNESQYMYTIKVSFILPMTGKKVTSIRKECNFFRLRTSLSSSNNYKSLRLRYRELFSLSLVKKD